MAAATPDHTPRWSHELVEETLDGTRLLTVTAVDRTVRGWWEEMARLSGIPRRRWWAHHPLGPSRSEPVVAMIDGRPAFDVAAWARLASLVPGAVALRARTAASMAVQRSELRPPGRPPLRLLDLMRARRRTRHLRRAERGIDGDLAAFRHHLGVQLELALAPGDDGTPFRKLAAYALAARFDDLLRTDGRWGPPMLVELAHGDATARLLRLLLESGRSAEAAYAEAARLSAGGGLAHDEGLEELLEAAAAPGARPGDVVATWLQSHGWRAMRDLHLEARPLRDAPDVVRSWLAAPTRNSPASSALPLPEEPPLADAVARVRHLTRLREEIARDRASLHAGLRALSWTLGARLHERGAIETVDDVFDLSVNELLAAARGTDAPHRRRDQLAAPTTDIPPPAPVGTMLHGTAASAGIATGRTVVVNDPLEHAGDVSGAVLVCRVTDPAWMPLLMQCAALVTERGGPLSHAAVVARELGVPAVLAVSDARALLAGGADVTVDGAAGTVMIGAATDPPVHVS